MALAFATALASCTTQEDGATPPPRPTPPPIPAAFSSATATPSEAPATAAPAETPLDLGRTKSWLADPRLADAKTKLDKGDAAGAAHVVDAFARSPDASSLDAAARDELAYLAGTLFARAGAPKPARDRFAAAFGAAPGLAAWA
ncbi:MAG TPA: hypothetical protein VL400_27415, partial [Polyangiaceae bacterium]|nr:hypothetical protein [Polyangiaceae bacterium]